MPLLGPHIAIGAVGYQFGFRSNFNKRWKTFFLIAILAGLPDFDFVLGFIITGNGHANHYGITHTIYFALLAGLVISKIIPQKMSWLSWQSRWVNFFFCFFLISSHSLADFIPNGKTLYFFYPLGVSFPARHLDFSVFVKRFFNYGLPEAKSIAICVGIIIFIQFVKLAFKKYWIFRSLGTFKK